MVEVKKGGPFSVNLNFVSSKLDEFLSAFGTACSVVSVWKLFGVMGGVDHNLRGESIIKVRKAFY